MIKEFHLDFLNLNQIIQILKYSKTENHGLVGKGVSSYNVGMPILEHPDLKGLKTIILKYVNECSTKPLKLINSWFNTMNPGDVLKIHKHEESILSGAFYVNVGEHSVPLIFKHYKVQPKNGLLVIFSSELEHYTEEEKQERTVISFNTDYL